MIDAVPSLPLSRPSVVALVALLLFALLPASVAQGATSLNVDTRFDVSLHLDWDTRKVHVKTTMDLTNTSAGPIDKLLLNTVAIKHGGLHSLKTRVDGVNVNATKGGQTIALPLGKTLDPGESATIFVAYRARLTTKVGGRAYFFAKLDGVAQLYRFIPWPSRRIPFTDQDHGEPFLTPVSSRVEVRVSADRPLVWATSGHRVGKVNNRTFEFVATDVRDFNLAASPKYKTVRGNSKDGETKIFAHVRRKNGRRLVNLARTELARYEAITGVPYQHDTFRIAETGGGLAMESPALIWLPGKRSDADDPYLISHEVAHQWWYSTVGNDQATNAFADEAMAEYYSRKKHLTLRSSRCKTDRLDRTIKSYSGACYYEVVYVQGARFLDKLRKDYGDAKFKAAVRAYTQGETNEIGSNISLLEAFRDKVGDSILNRLKKRFPGIY